MQTTVGMISLGCAKNRVDSEQMLGALKGAGYLVTNDPTDAEVLIVNTCGFIEPAKQESIDALLDAATYREKGRLKILVAAGCLAQRYADALHEEMPEVDAFLGVSDVTQIVSLIERAKAGTRPMCMSAPSGVSEGPRVLTTPSYSAYVRTGDGCDNRCTYCAIPLIRGGYRSRTAQRILQEAETLAAGGVREISLIAQDTTRFGDDLPGRPRLSTLVRDVAAIDGIRWVRVLYCYPSRVDDALLDALATEEKACAYLDLPLQHIDSDILHRMNRQGSPEEIKSLLLRARAHGMTLRTTMIVGFPGETDDQFKRLLDFVEEMQFDRLGAFTYSMEEDTPAATMQDQVPFEIARERLDTLMRLQQRISLARNQLRIGKAYDVLIEGVEGDRMVARTRMEAPEGDGSLYLPKREGLKPGQFVNVRIVDADPYDIIGEYIG